MRLLTLCISLLGGVAIGRATFQDPSQADKRAVESVRSLAQKIEQCPATEEVAQFKKKWVKVAWGPPRDVKFDVEKAASLVAPYRGTITFSLPYSGGEQQQTEHEARGDKNLRLIFLSPVRYTLRVAPDSSPQFENKQIKNTLTDTWSDYSPVQPERFCWITVVK